MLNSLYKIAVTIFLVISLFILLGFLGCLTGCSEQEPPNSVSSIQENKLIIDGEVVNKSDINGDYQLKYPYHKGRGFLIR